jgi:1-acyl-sn-glycerol-3-phosphate acyltransferase
MADARRFRQLPPRDVSVLLVSNHKCDLDYFFVWALAARLGPLQPGGFNAVAKSVLRKVPLFGWVFKLVNFLFLSRSWEADGAKIGAWTAAARHSGRWRPTWLLLYPEGTRYTAPGKVKSDAAAAAAGVPPLRGELLLPRHKGFVGLANDLLGTEPGCCRYLLDITICYIGRDGLPVTWSQLGTSALLSLGAGRLPLSRVLVHAELHAAGALPAGDEPRRLWLLERWRRKEALLAHAQAHGRFPDAAQPVAAGPGGGSAAAGPFIPAGQEEARLPAARALLVAALGVAACGALLHMLHTQWAFRLYALCSTLGVAAFAYIDPVF